MTSADFDYELHDDFNPYSGEISSLNGHDRAHGQDAALEHPCGELKKMLGGGTFYYSSDCDLTSRLQDR